DAPIPRQQLRQLRTRHVGEVLAQVGHADAWPYLADRTEHLVAPVPIRAQRRPAQRARQQDAVLQTPLPVAQRPLLDAQPARREGPGQPAAPRLPPEAHRLRAALPPHLPALPLPAGAAAALPRAGPRPLEPAQPLQVFVLVAHLGLLLSDTAQRFRRRVFPFRRLAGFFPAACSPLASTRGSTRAISSRVRAPASSRRDRSTS